MAWAEKLPSGRYRGRYRDPDNRQQTVLDERGRGFERKRDALHAANEKEVSAQRRAAESTKPAAKITWGEWWERIRDERDNPLTGTFEVEESYVRNHIEPWWGDEPLNQIKRRDVQRWIRHPRGLKVRPGMQAATVRRIYRVFSATLRMAVEDEVLDATPCVRIDLPHVPRRRQPHHTVDTIARITRSDYRAAAEFILETGLRPGELCGLHVDYLDRETGWLTVWLVYVGRRRIIRPFPKDDDERLVPLTPRALEIIDEQLDGRDLTGGCGVPHAGGERCKSALVFLTRDGAPMRPHNLSRHLSRIDLPSMYAGRRGWVTRAADGGASPFDIAAAAGHSDVKTTQGYWQQTPAARGRMIAALGQSEGLRVVTPSEHEARAREHDDATRRTILPRGADRGAEPRNTTDHDEAPGAAESGG